jgi:hypothetical protein
MNLNKMRAPAMANDGTMRVGDQVGVSYKGVLGAGDRHTRNVQCASYAMCCICNVTGS